MIESAIPPSFDRTPSARATPSAPGSALDSGGWPDDPSNPPLEPAFPSWEEELDLSDLDQLVTAPGDHPEPGEVAAAPTAPTRTPEPAAVERSTSEVGGGLTPYLEERLELAQSGVSSLRSEVAELDKRWQGVRDAIGSLTGEVERAHREMEFLKSAAKEERAEPAPLREPVRPQGRPMPATDRSPGRPISGRARSLGGRTAAVAAEPFRAFTAERYNQTMADLRGRRRKLVGWTLILAALISTGLIFITAIYPEPTPPVWIAALPAVWMIPVPFFILSFRGTQRVLRANHLSVEDGP